MKVTRSSCAQLLFYRLQWWFKFTSSVNVIAWSPSIHQCRSENIYQTDSEAEEWFTALSNVSARRNTKSGLLMRRATQDCLLWKTKWEKWEASVKNKNKNPKRPRLTTHRARWAGALHHAEYGKAGCGCVWVCVQIPHVFCIKDRCRPGNGVVYTEA